MIVLHLDQEVAASPYFVIHHLQRADTASPGWVVSGILGDGWYEGEVAVEMGSHRSVTFADEWFSPAALQEFLQRVGREQICAALYAALAGVSGEAQEEPDRSGSPMPHWHVSPGHGVVGGGTSRWAVPA